MTEETIQSQNKTVLEVLKSGNSLTRKQAVMHPYYILNLPAIINNLRNAGHPIITDIIKSAKGKGFAKYRLIQ